VPPDLQRDHGYRSPRWPAWRRDGIRNRNKQSALPITIRKRTSCPQYQIAEYLRLTLWLPQRRTCAQMFQFWRHFTN
jgi:hypothetical protein